MKTLSATKSGHLGFSGMDYALVEYDLTKEEVGRAGKKVMAEIKKERKEGKLKPWKP